MTAWDIFETEHWRVSHRRDARYSGYLMVGAIAPATDFTQLEQPALASMGDVLRRAEQLLMQAFEPCKVIVYKLGFSPGFNLHFHVVAVTRPLLLEITDHPGYANEPDGNDAILFLSREYCERPLSHAEQESQHRTVARLRVLAGVASGEPAGSHG